MRTELYERYKQEHPEELTRLNALYDNNARIEERRETARQEKLKLIAEWKRRLGYGDDHTGRGE